MLARLKLQDYDIDSGGCLHAALLFTYTNSGNMTSQSLTMSPALKRVVESCGKKFEPPASPTGQLDGRYLDSLADSINSVVKSYAQQWSFRRRLVAALLHTYGDCVTDYDRGSYEYAVLHMTVDECQSIIHVSLLPDKTLTFFAPGRFVFSGDDAVVYSESEPLDMQGVTKKWQLMDLVGDQLMLRIRAFVSNCLKFTE